jgi:hypothetical protein
MAGTCGKDGQQSSEANAVWQTRRKEKSEILVQAVRRCGGQLERHRITEMAV